MTDEEQKLDEILPCRKCGELDYEMWDGTGLWIAGLYCNNCDSQEEIELSGSIRSYEGVCVFDRKTQSHPKQAIARYKSALIKEWNRRAPSPKEAELQEKITHLQGQNERLERKKEDYPNVLAKVMNDLEDLRAHAFKKEASLQAEVKKLREALEVYASEMMWIDCDKGKRVSVSWKNSSGHKSSFGMLTHLWRGLVGELHPNETAKQALKKE